MPTNFECIEGKYYQFNSRKKGREVGRLVPKEKARVSISGGEDIYTLTQRDAKKLAILSLKGSGNIKRSHKKGNYQSFELSGDMECGKVYFGEPKLIAEEESESEGEE